MKDVKGLKEVFLYKNIIPVPNALVQAFLKLSSFEPDTVALAFHNTMSCNDQDTEVIITNPLATPALANSPDAEESTPIEVVDSTVTNDFVTPILRTRHQHSTKVSSEKIAVTSPWLTEFIHVFHF